MAEPTFEERYESISHEIEKRRPKWTLSSTPFDDVKQRILHKVFIKYETFIPSKLDKHGRPVEFSHWVNKVISNEIKNCLRDLHFKWSRPCIQGKGGCPFNSGGDGCSQTKSGKQCDECLIFKSWRVRKESHFAIKQTLPLETHAQEVNNIQSDFLDIEGAKVVIDAKMKERLTTHEWKIYRYMFILNKTPEETGKILGYRKRKGSKTFGGYQVVLRCRHKIVALARKIIEDENLG